MSEPQKVAGDQITAALMALPAGIRTLVVFAAFGLVATISALKDTLLSKICAWALSHIGLYGYHLPANLVFIAVHVYLFLVGQPSWRETALTVRRFASRDDADDELLTKLFTEGCNLTCYVFMSLTFRNVGGIWRFCGWTFTALTPVLSFIGLAGTMWLITIDNPVQTFNEEVAKIWNFAWPKVVATLRALYRLWVAVVRRCLQLFVKITKGIVAYRDGKTATHVTKLQPYIYSALARGEIRLLKLSKATPWSPVQCTLEHVLLDKAPQFETISYTWGSQQNRQGLILGGKRFDVSERVYEIVHDRASFLMTRHIWIDSICINQKDDIEKSSQVKLMRNIYGSSYHTVVWLGHAPDANDAIGLLAHLRRRIDFDDSVKRAALPLMNLNIENPSWPALNKLVRHDYWARCWVIQEIAVSKKVIVSYGGELITWDYFSSLMQILFISDPNSMWHISKIYWRSFEPPPVDAGIQVASLGRVRETIHASRSMNLFDLLISSINSTATDARDNIFALQGISTAADSGDIMPDYTSTIERPFLRTAEYLLKQEYPARMLHLAGIGFHRNRDVKLSWVPDWSTKRLSGMFWRHPTMSPYQASCIGDEELHMQLGTDGQTLVTKGIKVDCIKELGPRYFGISENGVPKTELFPGNFGNLAKSRDLVLNGSLKEPYVTGIPLIEAFWRMLLGDRTPAGPRPAEPIFFDYYKALERFMEVLDQYGPDMSPLTSNLPEEDLVRLGNEMTRYAEDTGRFANVSGPHTRERAFAITERGYIGMVPPYSKVGDEVFIISGAQVPFLLRRQGSTEAGTGILNNEKWQLVGESYVQGMMDGEMVSDGQVEEAIEIC
ncbi:heterokaryon incompatibility protein [Pochonia chlamydosporia 170]|uniref:Heterokaryon incompatibility protein n=1 Tax=Pochonia chlamydosporia 170 TaxID=1380566 RepID=A0A179F1N9_METCM|nr:heterokaryon incompatibility protein [Pochonia chlamydosporia 170]OAQ59386.1 heterokaryon incompatibility protein [Pochonia chlamydosporia 170]